EGDTAHELNLGHTRLYARIEDPLYLEGRGHTVEQVRDSERLRSAYFRRVFALMAVQSDCNLELAEWFNELILPERDASEFDLLAAIQTFNHNIVKQRRSPGGGRDAFQRAMHDYDFSAHTPEEGPISLRLSVRPHRQE